MTVLQQYPFSFSHGQFDGFFGELTLALTERKGGEVVFESGLFSKVSDFKTRISTGTQYEDEWGVAVTVFVGLFEVKWWRFNVLSSDFVADDFLN